MIVHGGDLTGADQHYGVHSWLDFSSNINPLGVPAAVLERLHRAVDADLTRYPDPRCRALCADYARRCGVEPECVMAGNGVSELLQLAAMVLPDGPVLLPVPAYGGYQAALERAGKKVRILPLTAETNFCIGSEDLRRALDGCDSLLLGNPNNPTSTLIEPLFLLSVLGDWLDRGGSLVIDEAFIELTRDGVNHSLLPLVGGDNVLVLRAVTKFLALPGLRLGFAIGGRNRIRAMMEQQLDWSVNALAQSIGPAFAQLDDYQALTDDWLCRELPRMAAALTSLPGLKVWQPETNFVLCQLQNKMKVPELQQCLSQFGILVRNCASFTGLDESYFRAAIKSRSENDRLIEALRQILS